MSAKHIQIQERSPADLQPYEKNARVHSKKQIGQIAASITRFGFNVPVLIDRDDRIIAGHGRVEAAKSLGLKKVPTILLDHLSDAERRAFLIADNKIALNATWDMEKLSLELLDLGELEFDLSLTGFSLAEIDQVIDLAKAADPSAADVPAEDEVPPVRVQSVTCRGDLFKLGHHYLLCGDARSKDDVQRLMQGGTADLIFTDPPYNVPINGHVSGLGKNKHREFAMASGEMSDADFVSFLSDALGAAASVSKDGAVAFVCMDWRGMLPLLTAGQKVFTEFKQLCVRNKTNAGMGTFYRSKHELVFVFKKGRGPHTNTFGLGDTGRYRTNVWDYPGISSLTSQRADDLARHPTPKPVAMVKDAILDCTRRGEVVLDTFAGSGSTLIAAQQCGRSARLLEYDPLYCDVIIERYQQFTGQAAVLTTTGQAFEDLQVARAAEAKERAA
jgi:DNA modification methylase